MYLIVTLCCTVAAYSAGLAKFRCWEQTLRWLHSFSAGAVSSLQDISLKLRHEGTQLRLQSANAIIEHLKTQVSSLQHSSQHYWHDQSESQHKANIRLEVLESEVKDLSTKLDVERQTVEDLKIREAQTVTTNESLQANTASLRQQNAALTHDKAVWTQQTGALTADKAGLEQQIETLQTNMLSAINQTAELTAANTDLTQQIARLRHDETGAAQQTRDSTADVTNLIQQNRIAQQEVTCLQAKLHRLTQQQSVSQTAYCNTQEELAQLRSQLAAAQSTIQQTGCACTDPHCLERSLHLHQLQRQRLAHGFQTVFEQHGIHTEGTWLGFNMADQYRALAARFWQDALEGLDNGDTFCGQSATGLHKHKRKVWQDWLACCTNTWQGPAAIHQLVQAAETNISLIAEYLRQFRWQRDCVAKYPTSMAPSTPPNTTSVRPNMFSPSNRQNLSLPNPFSWSDMQPAASTGQSSYSASSPARPAQTTHLQTSRPAAPMPSTDHHQLSSVTSYAASSRISTSVQTQRSTSSSTCSSLSSAQPRPRFLSQCGKEGRNSDEATLHLDAHGHWVNNHATGYKSRLQNGSNPLIPAFISRDGQTGRGSSTGWYRLSKHGNWYLDRSPCK